VNPNSLANLKPFKPGQSGNPSGANDGPMRPFTYAMRTLSTSPLPEHLRVAMNARFRQQLFPGLKGQMKTVKKPEDIPDFYHPGITWAQANAVRQGLAAIVEGNIGAAIELRESVEGRATTRVEFVSQNDKLEALLAAFRAVADQPTVIDVPVLPSTTSGNGSGNTNGAGNTE
jgi:hypothetical protein